MAKGGEKPGDAGGDWASPPGRDTQVGGRMASGRSGASATADPDTVASCGGRVVADDDEKSVRRRHLGVVPCLNKASEAASVNGRLVGGRDVSPKRLFEVRQFLIQVSFKKLLDARKLSIHDELINQLAAVFGWFDRVLAAHM